MSCPENSSSCCRAAASVHRDADQTPRHHGPLRPRSPRTAGPQVQLRAAACPSRWTDGRSRVLLDSPRKKTSQKNGLVEGPMELLDMLAVM